MKKIYSAVWLILAVVVISHSCRGDGEMVECPYEKCVVVPKGATSEQITELINSAEDGGTVYFPEGRWELRSTIKFSRNNIRIKGAGIGKTVLDFRNQVIPEHKEEEGEEGEHEHPVLGAGIYASGENIKIEDLEIVDTKGDAIRVENCRNIEIRRVKTWWRCGACSENGDYGIYPVKCVGVLIEESVASGAADAGIYVGQATDAVIRKNIAYLNVAGIEVENTHNAEVYDNVAYNNTGGILIFSLPGLSVPDTKNVKVYSNTITQNNTGNFANEGIVQIVPKGLGMLVMAAQNVDVYQNKFDGNDTIHIAITSYYLTGNTAPAGYFPLPKDVRIYDNEFGEGGKNPDKDNKVASELSFYLQARGLNRMPDILYDGVIPPGTNLSDNPMNICHKNNRKIAEDGDEILVVSLEWGDDPNIPKNAYINPEFLVCP